VSTPPREKNWDFREGNAKPIDGSGTLPQPARVHVPLLAAWDVLDGAMAHAASKTDNGRKATATKRRGPDAY